jgi:uncharacterized protein (TIRG00374 family)
MKKISHIFVSLLTIGSVWLFILLIKKYPTDEIIKPILQLGFVQILTILFLTALYFIIYTYRWQKIIKLAGYNISFKKLLSYKLAGYSFSYLTPLADYGGEPITAYLMNKENPEIGFSKSLAAVIASRIISAIPESFFLLTSIFYVIFFLVLPSKINFIFYILLGLVIVLLTLLYFIIIKKEHPLSKIINIFHIKNLKLIKKHKNSIKNFDDLLSTLFHHNPKELLFNIFLSFLAISSLICMFWYLAESLGASLNMVQAITSRSITSATTSLIPVPANIGIGEATESAWFGMLGLGSVTGFSFYLLIRAKDILIATIGMIILINKGFIKNLSKIREILKNDYSISAKEEKKK